MMVRRTEVILQSTTVPSVKHNSNTKSPFAIALLSIPSILNIKEYLACK